MANTDLSYYRNDPYIGGPYNIMWFKAGDGNMKAGYIAACHGTNANEIVICPTDGPAFGAIALRVDAEVDTLIPDNEEISLYTLGAGTLMKLKHDGTNQTLKKGDLLARSNTVTGASEKFAYVADTSELASAIGRSAELIATGGVAIWIDAILGL